MSEELIDEKFKNQQKQIDEHEGRLNDLEKTYNIMQKMDLRMGNVEKSVDKINAKLDKQGEEKCMKWDKLIDYLFYFFIATILGYIVMKLGLK